MLFNRLDFEKDVLSKIKETPKKQESQDKNKSKKEDKTKAQITIDDFSKIELKAGKIIEAKKHSNAKKLLVMQVDIGSETRQIVSGIADYFKPEDIVGKQVVVVTNLKPAKLRGEISQGMILICEDSDGNLSFVNPDKDMNPGSGVS